MARRLKTDAWLFGATLLLVATGVAWVFSAAGESALLMQVLWIALGGVGLYVAMNVDYKKYNEPKILGALIGLTLFGLVVVFFFPRINGSHRWIRFGDLGLQPSEFAKLVVILFGAATIGRKLEAREALEPAFARTLVLASAFCALVFLEPDAGSAAMIIGLAAAMIFVAGLPYKWVAAAALVAPVLGYVALVAAGYRAERIAAFFSSTPDPFGQDYQPRQALIAVGSGGWLGKGFMSGIQRHGFLPEAHNDYIYAVISEEKGLLGAAFVLLCFAVIVWRGLRVARRAPDAFGSLVAVGITTFIGLQALFNISVVLKLVPPKGIPLPFVSKGGSSMLVCLLAMGVLLNISQQASATDA